MTAVLALVVDPVVQARAQAELDTFVGKHRLPDFSDRENLPYIQCIISETFRWTVTSSDAFRFSDIAPLSDGVRQHQWVSAFISYVNLLFICSTGVPHRLTEDDIYNGMYIPAGTTIVANSWYCLISSLVFLSAKPVLGQCCTMKLYIPTPKHSIPTASWRVRAELQLLILGDLHLDLVDGKDWKIPGFPRLIFLGFVRGKNLLKIQYGLPLSHCFTHSKSRHALVKVDTKCQSIQDIKKIVYGMFRLASPLCIVKFSSALS